MSATIATMLQIGWQVNYMEVWRDPDGQRYVLDLSGDISEFIQKVSATVIKLACKRASMHWQGKGLENGFAPRATFRMLRSLRRHGDLVSAGILESTICAGMWSDVRVRHVLIGLDVQP